MPLTISGRASVAVALWKAEHNLDISFVPGTQDAIFRAFNEAESRIAATADDLAHALDAIIVPLMKHGHCVADAVDLSESIVRIAIGAPSLGVPVAMVAWELARILRAGESLPLRYEYCSPIFTKSQG